MLRTMKGKVIFLISCYIVGFIVGVIQELRQNAEARKVFVQVYKRITGSKQYSKPVVRLADLPISKGRTMSFIEALRYSDTRCASWCNDPHCQGECRVDLDDNPGPVFSPEKYVRDDNGFIVVTECFACDQPCSKLIQGPSFCSYACEKRYEDDMLAMMEGERRAEQAANRYFEESYNRFGGWDLDD